ncbi:MULTISPECIES: hypothetical protein [Rhodococcus]|uniref:Uncharacterized protein n=1 Tax=Rhodococcus opacus RKJ300 = JCM 13270 TaxID=1165867 RepID=I0WST7_RHOOP|nr:MULTISPECIES: hypothetical protein [Rhodococcus]EID79453.1 hypothetical protein W59_13631 [Rhodococcus opacus RKJ300 = JCM 13270]QQZ15049.1 hypothetical protein GO592_02230 [Rhodococcus sp. 21391]
MWPTHWPAVARDIAEALDAAIVAARASDSAALTEATEELAALPAEQVGAVLAGVVRELLETLHPDGLTGEDVQDVLTRCARAAALWFPVVDVDSLVTVLTGALGVADVEENPRRPERAVEAAILVIADLLSAAEVSADGYVRRALDEIARAETVEMP